MPPPRITATNHTAFTVSDLAEAAAFFREVLGFPVTSVTRQSGDVASKISGLPGAVLDILYVDGPGHRIELMQYLAPGGRSTFDLRPCDPGFSHIAYEVDDIDALLVRTEAAGYAPFGPPQTMIAGPRIGGKNVYLRGPDGIVIEFQQVAPQNPEHRSAEEGTA